MIEKYNQNGVVSPFQLKRGYDIQRPDHPVQDEVRKFTGKYSIVAEVEEDRDTIAMLDMPGLVSFLTTFRDSEGRILSQGRGSAVLNQSNRFISKMVNMAFGSSFVDAAVRSAKVFSNLTPDRHAVATSGQHDRRVELSPRRRVEEVPGNYRNSEPDSSFQPASQKQKNYLLHLLKSNDASEEEFAAVSGLSKDEAAEKIGKLVAR
jgi:hypothetical protein